MVNLKVVPLFTPSDSTHILPPCMSIILCTSDKPMPVPEDLESSLLNNPNMVS